eukprot:TRINITY_DN6893_c0_g1_i1.p1 TRINITY_DN6893_c0_g1~~TRINITY_DN6893_c0_g1_i1.p1  ORF type:complete len:783 (-),score=183.17 TRINITY_DN6893_c0_g1_i1:116-2407(-)
MPAFYQNWLAGLGAAVKRDKKFEEQRNHLQEIHLKGSTSLHDLLEEFDASLVLISAPEVGWDGNIPEEGQSRHFTQPTMAVCEEMPELVTCPLYIGVDFANSSSGNFCGNRVRWAQGGKTVMGGADDFEIDWRKKGVQALKKCPTRDWMNEHTKRKMQEAVRNSFWICFWRGKCAGALTAAMMEKGKEVKEGKIVMVIAVSIDGGVVTQVEKNEIVDIINDASSDLKRRSYSFAKRACFVWVSFPSVRHFLHSLAGTKRLHPQSGYKSNSIVPQFEQVARKAYAWTDSSTLPLEKTVGIDDLEEYEKTNGLGRFREGTNISGALTNFKEYDTANLYTMLDANEDIQGIKFLLDKKAGVTDPGQTKLDAMCRAYAFDCDRRGDYSRSMELLIKSAGFKNTFQDFKKRFPDIVPVAIDKHRFAMASVLLDGKATIPKKELQKSFFTVCQSRQCQEPLVRKVLQQGVNLDAARQKVVDEVLPEVLEKRGKGTDLAKLLIAKFKLRANTEDNLLWLACAYDQVDAMSLLLLACPKNERKAAVNAEMDTPESCLDDLKASGLLAAFQDHSTYSPKAVAYQMGNTKLLEKLEEIVDDEPDELDDKEKVTQIKESAGLEDKHDHHEDEDDHRAAPADKGMLPVPALPFPVQPMPVVGTTAPMSPVGPAIGSLRLPGGVPGYPAMPVPQQPQVFGSFGAVRPMGPPVINGGTLPFHPQPRPLVGVGGIGVPPSQSHMEQVTFVKKGQKIILEAQEDARLITHGEYRVQAAM